MLPNDCTSWLDSKSKINRAGTTLAENPANYIALRQVQCYRLFRALTFPQVFNTILPVFDTCNARVAGRLKRLPSIVRKMGRDRIVDLAQLADLVGIRIICESPCDADRVCNSVAALEHHKKTIDYVGKPRDSGYRGRHCILKVPQHWPSSGEPCFFEVEIQVRTWFQHLWALVSERYGEQVKEGGGTRTIRDYLEELSRLIAAHETKEPTTAQIAFAKHHGAQSILVSRRASRGAERPYSEDFKTDYEGALRRLLAWEEDLGASDYDVLFLIGIGDPKLLGQTHAVFFGVENIPLPRWAPAPPT